MLRLKIDKETFCVSISGKSTLLVPCIRTSYINIANVAFPPAI